MSYLSIGESAHSLPSLKTGRIKKYYKKQHGRTRIVPAHIQQTKLQQLHPWKLIIDDLIVVEVPEVVIVVEIIVIVELQVVEIIVIVEVQVVVIEVVVQAENDDILRARTLVATSAHLELDLFEVREHVALRTDLASVEEDVGLAIQSRNEPETLGTDVHDRTPQTFWHCSVPLSHRYSSGLLGSTSQI